MKGEAADVEATNSCIARIEELDKKYLWPIFIYKHKRLLKKIKQGQQFEVADMLQEYKMIEEELNEVSSGSDSDEKYDRIDMSFNVAAFQARRAGGTRADGPNGILSQYVKMKSSGGGSQYAKGGTSNKTLKISGLTGNKKDISISGFKGGN